MKNFLQINQIDSAIKENWGWFLTWGIILVIVGILAIRDATSSTLVSVFFLGIMLLIGGIVSIIDAFAFWRRRWQRFFLLFLLGLLYIAIGIVLMHRPIAGALSITLTLGIFYIILGCIRIFYFLTTKTPLWGWGFVNGLISFILGILILASWPASSLYIIGLFIGIDLIFWGWSYIMVSLSAKNKVISA